MIKKSECPKCKRIVTVTRAGRYVRHLNNSGSLCAGSTTDAERKAKKMSK